MPGTKSPDPNESVRSPSASNQECVGVAQIVRLNLEMLRVVSRVPP
jgi:hypothetical protein